MLTKGVTKTSFKLISQLIIQLKSVATTGIIFIRGLTLRLILIVFFVTFLIACSSAVVPYTSDPDVKVAQAKWLFEEKYRAIPAEKLLHEARNIYEKDNNETGLAELNRVYAMFLSSYSVDRYQSRFEDKGFMEPGVTYDNRYSKSIEYFIKSEKYYISNKEHDSLTNIYLRMAFTYAIADDVKNSCGMFDRSIEENKVFMTQNPEAIIELDGYPSYMAYVSEKKKIAGCG